MIPPFVRKAGAPFDRPNPDTVLRSADGVDFHTFKTHLSSASDLFSQMFSLPQPSEKAANEEEELADGLPIVPIHDPSSVLEALLCYCDPNITCRSNSVPLIEIQNLAMKYDMTPVVKAIYRDRIRLERVLPPSRMLDTIRQRVGQDEDMYFAAANIFISPEDEMIEMVDLGLVNKAQFDSLVRYRDDCRASAIAVASPPYNRFTWIPQRYNWFRTDLEHDSTCDESGYISMANVRLWTRLWWMFYMYEADIWLAKRPWGETVTSGDFFDRALKAGSRCRVCREGLDDDFRQFTNLFAREIDDAVSRVRYR